MKRKMLLIWLLIISICFMGMGVEAKTLARYTTKTVALNEAASTNAKTVYKIKQNRKLTVTNQGKTWVTVTYNCKTLYAKKAELHKTKAINKYPGRKFRRVGRSRWNKCIWTYYSQRVLPGRGLKIPGRHVDSRGFVCDKDGYICLGSSVANKRKKLVVPTPFGKYGKVYDCGAGNSKWFDTYVAW